MMEPRRWMIFALVALLLLIGCGNSGDDDDDDATPDDDDDNDDDDTSPPDDDDDTAFSEHYVVDLDFELRGQARLDMTVTENTIVATFEALTGNDVIAQGTSMDGAGWLDRYEGELRMYALRFGGPALGDGPCGSAPVSYSVTLSAKRDNNYLSGGFVAYCGKDIFTGRPAKVYRLSGIQPPPEK